MGNLLKDGLTVFNLTRLLEVTHAGPRSKTLHKLGLLLVDDFKVFNKLFKKSAGWKKTPASKNALVKS